MGESSFCKTTLRGVRVVEGVPEPPQHPSMATFDVVFVSGDNEGSDADAADDDCLGFLDGDGDGYCPEGEDLDDDGDCIGGLEPNRPGDCDDGNSVVHP